MTTSVTTGGRRSPLRAVYLDLDGTLLGRGGSILHDGDGAFTLLGVRALEACARADVEVVLVSGRRRASLSQDARLLGIATYACEAGALLVAGGEDVWLTGAWQPRDGQTVFAQIEASGAPRMLMDRFDLRPHEADVHPREISHVYLGEADVDAANALLEAAGLRDLRLIDNGAAEEGGHVFHLMPGEASKAGAVAAHRRIRGYDAAETIAVGDSAEDAGMAASFGTFWFVANGAWTAGENVRRTEATHGDGVYEAVLTELAERR
jgi:phosphoglycolate phosphatase